MAVTTVLEAIDAHVKQDINYLQTATPVKVRVGFSYSFIPPRSLAKGRGTVRTGDKGT